ncbi:MAG: hypothetical protein RLZZ288_975 [Planctomycetota bacterium]|jgi:ABC-type transporter Mla subunit MlaD
MNRSKLEMKVGLFVVLATALVVSGVLVLGGRSLFSKRVMAYTILDENVVGLTVGSPVRVRGVQVGEVKRLSFAYLDVAPAKQVIGSGKGGLIRADLEILTEAAGIGPDELRDYLQNAVTLGLRARLAMAGITGGQYIEIEMSKDAPPPIDLPWKPEGLYIPGESSTLDQMLSNLRSTLRKIESLDLNAMVDRANAVLTRLDNVLQDDAPLLQSMLTSLKSTLDNLDRLVGSLRDDPARLLFAKPPQSVIPQGGQP